MAVKKTMSVRETGRMLGLGKTESYWLAQKGFFNVIMVGGKMRVVMESFENWYAGQTHYRKVKEEGNGGL